MPARLSAIQVRLNNVTSCLAVAASTLDTLAGSVDTPFLTAIAATTKALVKFAEHIKQNKDDYVQLMEQTNALLNTIIILHIKSDTGCELPPGVLRDIGRFTETLHKIHTFLEAQQNQNKIRQFFRQSEMSSLLKDCKAGLEHGLQAFEVQALNLMTDAKEMQQYAENRHQEVLEMITTLSGSDQTSLISGLYSGSFNSSNSISLLPSEPKIFHGRESELSEVLKHFAQGTPRIAVLGAGGMGKTSLARAILHHPDITARYDQHRHFVVCDSATTQVELAATIGAHLGLKPGKDLTRPVVKHLSSGPPSLLILDNLETLWEPLECRKDIEEFLALLADVDHLAVVITMRGAERPAKVQWTRPFLPPLKPLTRDAARNIFLDIADDGHVMEEVDRVLLLTDNMPLAIHLLAHLVETEGCSNVLSLWAEKKTSIISEGFDQGSNLDLSIALSLASPRIASLPQSQDLLSLLAILPDGLSDMELLGSKLPIPDILRCKQALLRTSLAYTDEHKRLKALVPIREYMLQAQPPRDELIRPVLSHFQQLLEFFAEYRGSRSGSAMVGHISSNYANTQNVIRNGLHAGHPDLKNSIYCTLHLNTFSLLTGRGTIPLLDQIPDFLPRPCDHRVEVHFISELLYSCSHHPILNAETLIAQAVGHFKHFEDPDLQCKFYNCLTHYQIQQKHDLAAATKTCQDALSLSVSTSNSRRQRETLHSAAWIKWKLGDYPAVEQYANELLRSARIAGDLWREAQALHILGMCSTEVGNYKRTISLCNRASQSLALCGITGGGATYGIRNSQAVVHNAKSEYVEARNIGVRILADVSMGEDPYIHAMASQSMAEVDLHMGAPQSDIQKNIDVAKSILNRVGQAGPALLCDVWQARLRLREGDILGASKLFQETFAASWGKDSTNAANCLDVLGDIGLWGEMGLTPGWSTWATLFLVYSLKLKKNLQIHKALRCLGDVFLVQGDEVTAIGLWTTALDGFTLMDIHRGRADCMLRLGDISKGHGDMQRAAELWKTARPLFERSSQVSQVKQIDERLDSMDCCDESPRSAVGVSP